MSRSVKFLTILFTLALLAALPAVASADRTIRGPGFRAHVPSGWKVKASRAAGWRLSTVTPPGRSTKGSRATYAAIADIPTRTLQKRTPQPLPRSDGDLATALMTVPAGATGVKPSLPALALLDRSSGASIDVRYAIAGVPGQTTTLVVRRKHHVYLIQTFSPDGVTFIGGSLLDTIRHKWHWT